MKYDETDTTIILNNLHHDHQELKGWLVLLDKDKKPIKSFEFKTDETSIGRDMGNDIVIPDKTVSRFHCIIKIQNHDIYLIEKNSINGILINDYPVVKSILQDGMNIQLGKINFIVKLL